ncbi:MAG: hypothetical protein ACKPFD_19875 [Dolichospermum sp.]
MPIFQPVSGANRCIYRFPAANCDFPNLSGSLAKKAAIFPSNWTLVNYRVLWKESF